MLIIKTSSLALILFHISNSSTFPSLPVCEKVCQQFSISKQPRFSFSIWTVLCQEEMCVTKSKAYSRFEIPRNLTNRHHQAAIVRVDLKLLKLTGINFDEDSLDIGLWVGMEWEDMNLSVCDCSDQNRTQIDMDLEGEVWLPDLAIFSWKKLERVTILTPEKQFLVQKRKGTVMVYFSVDLRTTVMCPFNPSWYPFDRNLCYVRVGSYSHTDEMIQFVRNSFSSKKIIYKDIKVFPKALCEEESGLHAGDSTTEWGTLDGFKIILNREGVAMKMMYTFTMNVFVITASLASLLPSKPQAGLEVDKSAPLIEAAISSYYVLFDLLSQTPLNSTGDNMMVEFVRSSNYFVYLSMVIYFGMLFYRRFGKMTAQLGRAAWQLLVGVWGKVVSVRGKREMDVVSDEGRDVEEVVEEGDRNRDRVDEEEVVNEEGKDVEEDEDAVNDDVLSQEDAGYVNMVCYFVNKGSFLVLLLVYWGFSNSFWLWKEMEAMSMQHHNRVTSGACMCTQQCVEGGHGGGH